VLGRTVWNYEILLINDYSPDGSWEVIQALCRDYPCVVGVDLRRNFGQDNAILTGLRLTRGAYVAIMDDDLQHDPQYLAAMVTKAEEGFDVVFATSGTNNNVFGRMSAVGSMARSPRRCCTSPRICTCRLTK